MKMTDNFTGEKFTSTDNEEIIVHRSKICNKYHYNEKLHNFYKSLLNSSLVALSPGQHQIFEARRVKKKQIYTGVFLSHSLFLNSGGRAQATELGFAVFLSSTGDSKAYLESGTSALVRPT